MDRFWTFFTFNISLAPLPYDGPQTTIENLANRQKMKTALSWKSVFNEIALN